MKILLLGGFRFVGWHLIQAGLQAGHEITVFNRGSYQSADFPGVEVLLGDRDGQLGNLQDREWDAVIDTSGYVPRIVKASVELLINRVKHYTFISSISVYQGSSNSDPIDEHAPVLELEDEKSEDVSLYYGALKARCEQELLTLMPDHSLIIRPGLIVGPRDYTDRFTYWPHRISQGGEVLLPTPREQRLQFIDVRDLAEWMIRMIEKQATGTYNVTGKDCTFEELVEQCQHISQSNLHQTWIDEDFLIQHEVGEWIELPLWIKKGGPTWMFAASKEKAIQAGLSFRPLQDTINETLHWVRSRPDDIHWRAGMETEREQDLLEKWRKSKEISTDFTVSASPVDNSTGEP